MKPTTLQDRLVEAEAAVRALQDEMAETNRGLVALSMELEERVDQRTAELAQSNEALRAEIAERKRQEERTALLSEVTSQLLSTDRPQQIVESLCQKVMAHLDCHAFFNFLVDERAGRLHLNACAGIPVEMARQIEWLDYGVAVCGCAARDGCRIVSEHIQTTPDPRTDLVRGFGIQAYACHPLLNQGQVIGTLSFGSRTKPVFAEDELRLMKAVTDNVAIAMQRLRLLESIQQRAVEAEAANIAKGRFLANISHELRTPMNAILGMVDLALPKQADSTARDFLQTARQSADLLLSLLNDLLDSAKIESGKLELESAPFSLRRVLEQTARVLTVRASEKGIYFSSRIPPEVPDNLIGDQVRLRQVLLNLGGNGIKFTEHGEVAIRVRIVEGSGKGLGIRDSGLGEDKQPATPDPQHLIPNPSVALEFAVQDTGIGISPRDRQRIFHPFAQADASTTRAFGGTGLGLTISSSLVGHDGRPHLGRERAGTGQHVLLHRPIALGRGSRRPSRSRSSRSAGGSAALRILWWKTIRRIRNWPPTSCTSAATRWTLPATGSRRFGMIQENRYDVILMDVQMPGMDGLETTATIRERENRRPPRADHRHDGPRHERRPRATAWRSAWTATWPSRSTVTR